MPRRKSKSAFCVAKIYGPYHITPIRSKPTGDVADAASWLALALACAGKRMGGSVSRKRLRFVVIVFFA